MIVVLVKAASNKTNPGSSHLEDKIKYLELLKYLKTLSTCPKKKILLSIFNFFERIFNSFFNSPSPKIIRLKLLSFSKIFLKALIKKDWFFCLLNLPILIIYFFPII